MAAKQPQVPSDLSKRSISKAKIAKRREALQRVRNKMPIAEVQTLLRSKYKKEGLSSYSLSDYGFIQKSAASMAACLIRSCVDNYSKSDFDMILADYGVGYDDIVDLLPDIEESIKAEPLLLAIKNR